MIIFSSKLFHLGPKYYQIYDEDSRARHQEVSDSKDGAVDSSDGAVRKVPARGEEAQLEAKSREEQGHNLKVRLSTISLINNYSYTFASIYVDPLFLRQERRGVAEG